MTFGPRDWVHLHALMTVYGTDKSRSYPEESKYFSGFTPAFINRKMRVALCCTSIQEYGQKQCDTYAIARHNEALCKLAKKKKQKKLFKGNMFVNGQPKGRA